MELTKEVIETHGLSDDQVTALNKFGTDSEGILVADAKKGYEGKANEDAEKILHDATTSVAELTGVKHEDGVKVKDYFGLAFTGHSKSKMDELDVKGKELDAKIVEAQKGGNEVLAKEFTAIKDQLDNMKKKEAEFDRLNEGGFEQKYLDKSKDYDTLTKGQAFLSVRPTFAKDVNTFEATARWEAFMKATDEKYHVKMVDNVAKAIDKENEFKIIDLKDLVGKDAELSKLETGRQVDGPGASQTKKTRIEGVPFEVSEDAKSNNESRTEAIRKYLSEKGMHPTSAEYTKEFTKLNERILGINQKAA